MSRAVLLPTPCDPFILSLWIQSARKVWQNEVSKIYVCVNTFIDQAVIDYVTQMFHTLSCPVEIILVFKNWMDHGDAIKVLLEATTEQYIHLMEDDLFFLSPGYMKGFFNLVETGQCDALVSPRSSCSKWIEDACLEHYSIPKQIGNEVNFWPSLIIIDKQHLLATDCHFGPKSWSANEKILSCGSAPVDLTGDTFVWTSIQLREAGLSFRYVNQLRYISPKRFSMYPIMMSDQLTYDKIPWVHIGASSSGILGYLLDNNNCLLGYRSLQASHWRLPDPHTLDDGLKEDFAKRVAFWQFCLKHFRLTGPAEYFNDIYAEAALRLSTHLQLDQHSITQYHQEFESIFARIL